MLQVGPGRFFCYVQTSEANKKSPTYRNPHHIHAPLYPNEVWKKPKKKGLPELVKFIFSILPTQLVKFIYYTILLMILIPSPIDILVTTQKPCFSRGMNLRALGIWAIGRKWLVSLRYPTKKKQENTFKSNILKYVPSRIIFAVINLLYIDLLWFTHVEFTLPVVSLTSISKHIQTSFFRQPPKKPCSFSASATMVRACQGTGKRAL